MTAPPPNLVIRQVRETEFQMSRGEFANLVNKRALELGERGVGCIARTVATWEDGETACPRPVYRRVLTSLTGRTMDQLGFRAPSPPPSPAPRVGSDDQQAAREDRVDRRTMLLGTGALTLGIALPDLTTGRPGPGQLGRRHIEAVRTTTDQLYAHDKDHGAVALRRDAATALATAHNWLRRGTLSAATEQQLTSATGHLAVAAGWLSLDSGLLADARSLYTEALTAARISADPGLEAHAFACLSLLAHASGRPREAVGAAQAARTAATDLGSPRWLSLLNMREARGWALHGEHALTDQALIRAHDLYARGPSDADPDWLDFYNTAELVGLESLCRADLGQHQRAAAGAQNAVLLSTDGYTRNRALYTADVALYQAVGTHPDPEAAADSATQALAFLPDVGSSRLVRALGDIASALQHHRTTPAVATWFDAYDTALAA